MRRFLAVGAIVGALLSTSILTGAASGENLNNPQGEDFLIVQPSTSSVVKSSDIEELIHEREEGSSEIGEISPQLIDNPADWTACFGPVFNASYSLRDFNYVPFATGSVSLQCGPHDTKTYGWHHIQSRHQNQWQTLVDDASEMPGTIPWDDFMADVMDQFLAIPDGYTVEYSGKRCYTAKIQIFEVDEDGEPGALKFTFYPTTVISMTANRVITSYGPKATDCGRFASWAQKPAWAVS